MCWTTATTFRMSMPTSIFRTPSCRSCQRESALLFWHQSVVDFLGAYGCRTGVQATDVAHERRALVDHVELKSESQVGADIEIRGGKTVANQVRAACQDTFKCIQYCVEIPVSGHSFTIRWDDEAQRLVGPGRLEWSGAKEQPSIIGAT